MKLELNKTYEFDLGDMSHCGMSHQEMIDYYNDNSSPLSFLIERKLPMWFDNIKYDQKYAYTQLMPDGKIFVSDDKFDDSIKICPDIRDKETSKVLYDQKAFNAKGGDFNWSRGKGVDRKTGGVPWEIWCRSQNFIWTDFSELPKVRVVATTGKECLEMWPNGSIKNKEKELLFG